MNRIYLIPTIIATAFFAFASEGWAQEKNESNGIFSRIFQQKKVSSVEPEFENRGRSATPVLPPLVATPVNDNPTREGVGETVVAEPLRIESATSPSGGGTGITSPSATRNPSATSNYRSRSATSTNSGYYNPGGKTIVSRSCETDAFSHYGDEISIEEMARILGKDLDHVEKHLEEWGHASLSELVIIPDNPDPVTGKGPFAIENPHNYADYETKVRSSVQGGAVVSVERKLQLEGGVAVGKDELARSAEETDLVKNAIYQRRIESAEDIDSVRHQIEMERALTLLKREQDLGSSAAGGIENGLFPELPEVELPSSSVDLPLASVAQGSGGVTAPLISDNGGSLLKGDPEGPGALLQKLGGKFSLSEEDIQTIASSTTVTGKVLQFMSDPSKLAENHRAFIGLTQVSVSPGTRTRKDYYCEVQIAVEYARPKNGPESTEFTRSLDFNQSNSHPSVFAAFPLARAQIMDLQYSERSQFDLAVEAAGEFASAGQTQSANFLLKYAKRLQQDVGTRNALPVVVPSSTGHTISYRFEPSVMALSDPTKKRSKPGWVMHPTSIPVMMVLVCEKSELEAWDHVVLSVNTRWIPKKKRHWFNKLTTDWWIPSQRPGVHQTNTERLDLALRMDQIRDDCYFQQLLACGSSFNLSSELRGRYHNLSSLLGNSSRYQELPVFPPLIMDVFPSEFTKAQLKEGIYITGENFFPLYKNVNLLEEPVAYLNGFPMETCRVDEGGITVKPVSSGNDAVFPKVLATAAISVRTKTGGVSNKFPVALLPDEKPKADSPKAALLPVVSDVNPKKGYLNQPTYLAVKGANFKTARIAKALIGGRECELTVVSENAAVVVVPAWAGNSIAGRKTAREVSATLTFVSEGGIAEYGTAIVFDQSNANLFSTIKEDVTPLTEEQKKLLRIAEAYRTLAELGGGSAAVSTALSLSVGAKKEAEEK